MLTDATVTLQSYGYGGGSNAGGVTIPSGGFDIFFTLFASDGSELATDDDGCGAAKTYQNACLDAYMNPSLSAGSYKLALTESPNLPAGSLSDGFIYQGQGNFTESSFGCSGPFCDYQGNQHTGNWAVDVANVSSASTPGAPEPATSLLAACGLAFLSLPALRRGISKKGN